MSGSGVSPGSGPDVDLDPPPPGRVHREMRRVRLADVDPAGLVRFDAMARYLQDVAVDDVRDLGAEGEVAWVVRRTTIVIAQRLRYNEIVESATWCSGVGAAWAERRTTITGERGPAVETVSLWVSLSSQTLRPVPLDEAFFGRVSAAARSRRVKSRLMLPLPPQAAAAQSEVRPWPLRSADFDVMGHVNNAVSWCAAEEEAHRVAPGRRLRWGELEYRNPVEGHSPLGLMSRRDPDVVSVWLLDGSGEVVSAARFGLGRSDAPRPR